MVNFKIIQILSSFSFDDIFEFEKFVNSKYYSGEREYNKFFAHVLEVYSKGIQKMSNEVFIKHLKEKTGYSKITLLNRLSELYKICEMFLIAKEIEKDEQERKKLLMKIFSERNSEKLFEYTYNSVYKYTHQKKYNLWTSNILKEIYGPLYKFYFRNGEYGKFQDAYTKKLDYSIIDLLINVFQHLFEYNQQRHNGYTPNTEIVDELIKKMDVESIVEIIRKQDSRAADIITIHYYIHIASQNVKDNESYFKARKIHKKNLGSYDRESNQFLYFIFLTYCINQTNLGKYDYYYELFELINEKLETGYYDELKEYNMPVNNFRDYIIIGMRVNKLEWVKNFIQNYYKLVPEVYRDDEYNIGMGIVTLEEKNYEKALGFLQKVKKKNYLHYLDSGIHSIRAYFFLEMIDEMITELDKMKQYMKHHGNIAPYTKKAVSEYLKNAAFLIKYKLGKKDLNELKFFFKDKKEAGYSRWIIRYVNNIAVK